MNILVKGLCQCDAVNLGQHIYVLAFVNDNYHSITPGIT